LLYFEPSWPWAHRVLDLVRDVANPSEQDLYFPVTRNKDWFVGHSWAQGVDQTEDGKNQESTSEAVNCYYAVALFGLATNNLHIYNVGRVMMATEVRSTKKYWHMPPGTPVYAPSFAKNGMVGVLWSNKVDYATFFGDNVEYIHCIQMLPFTPVSSLYLAPAAWVRADYMVLKEALTRKDLKEEWKAYILEFWAIVDREAAWERATFLKDTAFLGGNSRSNLYWWIASRPLNISQGRLEN